MLSNRFTSFPNWTPDTRKEGHWQLTSHETLYIEMFKMVFPRLSNQTLGTRPLLRLELQGQWETDFGLLCSIYPTLFRPTLFSAIHWQVALAKCLNENKLRVTFPQKCWEDKWYDFTSLINVACMTLPRVLNPEIYAGDQSPGNQYSVNLVVDKKTVVEQ